ncbi:MAG TPA: PilT/PilU family type 4a pilus ATPase [Candidatus Baltobacteraceae bacterium]|jgi:twitching motility protein PilT|nr:PilT/PilU family type 4a pilus ATPase [Candidatus Baltobacteraceae bacterium]
MSLQSNDALDLAALRELLSRAHSQGASDLHLAADQAVFLRVDGVLRRIESERFSPRALEYLAQTLLHPGAWRRLSERGEGDAAFRDDIVGTMRVHAFRANGNIRLSLRLLSASIPTVEALHLPRSLCGLLDRSSGLILFVGPTGSGKSTTLAALIDHVNRTRDRHIITIEDPVEYLHQPLRSSIAHCEIGRDTFDYADAVRSSLRADPDIILIGELRSSETMSAALTAAETGHLVLSTLHTSDAAQTFDRIVNAHSQGSQSEVRSQLAQSLIAVVAQRLVPLASGRGRRAAFEILIATEGVRAMIRDGKTHQVRNAILTGRSTGMQTLEAHLSDMLVHGTVTLEAARAATDRPDEIRILTGVR